MFVGDKGKILSGFRVESPRLIPKKRMEGRETPPARRRQADPGLSDGLKQWAAACKGGAQSAGNFINAWPITEAVNLYAVALRTGKRLQYDAENMRITNNPTANRYLTREYRKGWEL